MGFQNITRKTHRRAHRNMHTLAGWERESQVPPNTLLVPPGGGLRLPWYHAATHPPGNHLCNTGKCWGRPDRAQSASPGHRGGQKHGPTPRRTLRPQEPRTPVIERPPDRKPRRFLRVPIQSRGRPRAAPGKVASAPGEEAVGGPARTPAFTAWTSGPAGGNPEDAPALPVPAAPRRKFPLGRKPPGAHCPSTGPGPPTWPCPRRGSRLRGPARSRPPSGLGALLAAHSPQRVRCYFCFFSLCSAPRDSSGAAPHAPARPTPPPARGRRCAARCLEHPKCGAPAWDPACTGKGRNRHSGREARSLAR